MVDNHLDLFMVYWKNNTRKALVMANNEENAIKEAQRFAGKFTKITNIEKLDIDSNNWKE